MVRGHRFINTPFKNYNLPGKLTLFQEHLDGLSCLFSRFNPPPPPLFLLIQDCYNTLPAPVYTSFSSTVIKVSISLQL